MTRTHRGITDRPLAALVMLILGLGSALIGFVGTASAAPEDDECVPKEATAGALSAWANDGAPFASHVSTPPTDPDGDDEASTTNLIKFLPAGTEKHVTKAAVPAIPGTEDHWENLGWYNWTGGPVDGPPDVNATGWHGPLPNPPNGAPHAPVPENVYSTSDDEEGNGGGAASYFKYDGDFVEGTPGTPAQAEESHTDYLWQKQVRTFEPGTDAVVCGTEGTPDEPEVKGIEERAPAPQVLGIEANAPAAAAPAAAAPSAIDAGLTVAESGTTSNSTTLWILAGAAFVLASLVLGFGPAPARGKRSL